MSFCPSAQKNVDKWVSDLNMQKITISYYQLCIPAWFSVSSLDPSNLSLYWGRNTNFWCSSLLHVSFMMLEALRDIWLSRDWTNRELPLIEKVVMSNCDRIINLLITLFLTKGDGSLWSLAIHFSFLAFFHHYFAVLSGCVYFHVKIKKHIITLKHSCLTMKVD